MKKTVKLRAGKVEKPFPLAHAQAILIHQIKNKCVMCWEIVGDDYEFNGVEINGVTRNHKTPKGKAKSVGNSTGTDTTE